VAPATPQLSAADAAYIVAILRPLRLAKAYVPVIKAPATAVENAGVSKSVGNPRDEEDELA
jgi:hypothetical protein